MEYHQTPVLFTKENDIVTAAVAKVAPKMKFIGLGLGQGDNNAWFEYFLNGSNHVPGAPIADAIDYHYYAQPSSRCDVSSQHGRVHRHVMRTAEVCLWSLFPESGLMSAPMLRCLAWQTVFSTLSNRPNTYASAYRLKLRRILRSWGTLRPVTTIPHLNVRLFLIFGGQRRQRTGHTCTRS